jgi:hypothetical protein
MKGKSRPILKRRVANQSIIVGTLKTKSLLPSLYKREEFPLLGILFLSLNRQRGVRGDFYNNMSFQLWTP